MKIVKDCGLSIRNKKTFKIIFTYLTKLIYVKMK